MLERISDILIAVIPRGTFTIHMPGCQPHEAPGRISVRDLLLISATRGNARAGAFPAAGNALVGTVRRTIQSQISGHSRGKADVGPE